MSQVKPMPPRTCTAVPALLDRRLAGEQLGRAGRAVGVAAAGVVERRPRRRRWRSGPARCGRTCRRAGASPPGTSRSARRTARARARSRGRRRARAAATPTSIAAVRTVPERRSRVGVGRRRRPTLAVGERRRTRPTGRQRVERIEPSLGRGEVGRSMRARRRRRASDEQHVELGGVLDDDRPVDAPSAASTPPTTRRPSAAPVDERRGRARSTGPARARGGSRAARTRARPRRGRGRCRRRLGEQQAEHAEVGQLLPRRAGRPAGPRGRRRASSGKRSAQKRATAPAAPS